MLLLKECLIEIYIVIFVVLNVEGVINKNDVWFPGSWTDLWPHELFIHLTSSTSASHEIDIVVRPTESSEFQ